LKQSPAPSKYKKFTSNQATNLRRDSLLFVGWAIFSAHQDFNLDCGQKKAAHPTCFAAARNEEMTPVVKTLDESGRY